MKYIEISIIEKKKLVSAVARSAVVLYEIPDNSVELKAASFSF